MKAGKKGARVRIERAVVTAAAAELAVTERAAVGGVTTLIGAIAELAPTLNALIAKEWTLPEVAALASERIGHSISAPTLGSYLRRIAEKGLAVSDSEPTKTTGVADTSQSSDDPAASLVPSPARPTAEEAPSPEPQLPVQKAAASRADALSIGATFTVAKQKMPRRDG